MEAAEILKSNPTTKDIPIIAVTASSMIETEQELRKTCDSFLHKPVSKSQIINEISRFIQWDALEESTLIEEQTQPEIHIAFDPQFLEQISASLKEKIQLYLDAPNTNSLSEIILELATLEDSNKPQRLSLQLQEALDCFEIDTVDKELKKLLNELS